MRPAIDLNSDLGESFGAWRVGDDEAMFTLVSSANVACGFHAGDPMTMAASARLAARHGVALGAHPGYRDLVGFGRRALETTRPTSPQSSSPSSARSTASPGPPAPG